MERRDSESSGKEDSLSEKEASQPSDLESGPKFQSPAQQQPQNAGEKDNAFMVKFEERDPENPKNFSSLHKVWMTAVLGLLAFAGSAGTSIIVPAEEVLSAYLHVSVEVTILVLSLYVLGKCWETSHTHRV